MKRYILLFYILILSSCNTGSALKTTPLTNSISANLAPKNIKIKIVSISKLRRRALPLLLKTREGAGKLSFQSAGITLGEMGLQKNHTVPILLMGLNDEDETVRNNSRDALSDLDKTAILYLKEALSDPYLAESAAMALGNLGSSSFSVIPQLVDLLSNSKGSVKLAALIALGEIAPHDPRIKTALISGLDDSNSKIVLFSAAISENPNNKLVVNSLIKNLNNTTPEIMAAILLLLPTMKKSIEKALPSIIKLMFHQDYVVRYATAKAMGTLKGYHPVALRALKEAGKDKSPLVRMEAYSSFKKIRRH
jgi:HEAT repeat protein